MSDIPEELVLKILVRLPTKSLLRFRHYCNIRKKEIYIVYDEKCSFGHFRTIWGLGFPFDRPQGKYYTVLGCVDGLICLWDDTHELNPVILWNPAIRKSYQVPNFFCKPFGIRSVTYLKCSFGFGFDVVANDYKILRIAFWFRNFTESRRVDRRPLSFSTKPVACSADIFSLSTKSWRCVSNSVSLQQLSVPVFVNGALHFLTRKDNNQCCIVYFSLNAETFMEMACPEGGKLNVDSDHRIVGSAGTIFLLHQFPGYQYDVWVMKEYNVEESWTKLCTVDMKLHPGIGWKQLISINWNGELIVCGTGSYVFYKHMKGVQILDFHLLDTYSGPHAEVYSESLVLLGDNNCVTHLQQNNDDNMQEEHIRKGLDIHHYPIKRRGKSARLPSINLKTEIE